MGDFFQADAEEAGEWEVGGRTAVVGRLCSVGHRIGLNGKPSLRDVVARDDLGTFKHGWTALAVPPHGSPG
ncbi:hypothetical protein ABTX34_35845 [Streptomyces sp. NPDC096538]|uniref:hypothetical protein n=1 Tax=Streptomyces sp. NPDC096538 TaxID=3155427 RepID=UPI00332F4CD0